MSLFHYLNYTKCVIQLSKVTTTNKQTTIRHNFGGHSPVAGLLGAQNQKQKVLAESYLSPQHSRGWIRQDKGKDIRWQDTSNAKAWGKSLRRLNHTTRSDPSLLENNK